jgi:hypothetical protein
MATKDVAHYIRWGPLGQAFRSKGRVVLLIDEVDKADLEFPNDLLHELDRMRFRVMETDEEIVAAERPVVVITSNNEKELPDAFSAAACSTSSTSRTRADEAHRPVHHPRWTTRWLTRHWRSSSSCARSPGSASARAPASWWTGWRAPGGGVRT